MAGDLGRGVARWREIWGEVWRDGHEADLLRRDGGRQDEAEVIRVSHHESADESSRGAVAGRPHELLLVVGGLEVDVEGACEVLGSGGQAPRSRVRHGRGDSRSSEAIRSHSRPSEAIRGDPKRSGAIRSRPRPSEAIRSNLACPRKCEVPLCSAQPFCMSASIVYL